MYNFQIQPNVVDIRRKISVALESAHSTTSKIDAAPETKGWEYFSSS